MKYKTMPAAVKTPPRYTEDDATRTFEAIVSVFNNVDHVKDIVRPGAFKDSINAWKASGDPIPVLWSHRMDDPKYNIGAVVDIAEVMPGDPRIPDGANQWVKENGGLWVKAELDTYESQTAATVWNLLRKRRVTQFSFAYDTIAERQDLDGNNELLKVWLHEIGPTPLGCNELTELIGAKSAEPEPDPEPGTNLPHRLTDADIKRQISARALLAAHL